MKATESRADIYLMALQSLSKTERERVISRLLDDPDFTEDIMDLALIKQRKKEASRPFREYLAQKIQLNTLRAIK